MDQDKDQRITHSELKVLFRAFGQTPSDAELNTMLRGFPNLIDFDTFLMFFKRYYREPVNMSTLLQAFQIFDTQKTGRITVENFKSILTSLSEPLSNPEVDHIVRLVEIDASGTFDYTTMAAILTEGPKALPLL